jgi:hypothetical protein
MSQNSEQNISFQKSLINKPIPSQDQLNKITQFFFTLQLVNKLYHWNTTSYARHMATDRFNSNLLSIIDKFIEVFIGRYKLKPSVSSIEIKDKYLTDDGIKQHLIRAREFIQNLESILTDTELLNIRDELISEINQTLYLFDLQ